MVQFIKDTFDAIYKEGLKFDGVIHFAGLKAVSDSIKNPLKYWSNNFLGTLNLLEVMSEFNCKKIEGGNRKI